MTGFVKLDYSTSSFRIAVLMLISVLFFPCLCVAEEEMCYDGDVEMLLKCGEDYLSKNDYNKALEAFIKGLQLSESHGMGPHIMALYKNIGNIYCAFGDYERAIMQYETGYDLREDFPDRKTECDILVNLTGAYCFVGNTEKARKSLSRARKLMIPDDSVKSFMADYSDGLIFMTEKRGNEAIPKFRKAAGKAPDDSYLCHALEKIYQCYMERGERDSVLHYLRICNEISHRNGMTDMYVQTLGDLADMYDKSDPDKAVLYKNLHTRMSDSIMQSGYNLREFYRLRNIQYLYELEKTDRKISELQLMQEMKDREVLFQQKISIVLIVALVVFLILMWILLRQKRKLRGAYKDLFEINQNTVNEFTTTRQQCDRYRERIRVLEDMVEKSAGLPGVSVVSQNEISVPASQKAHKYSASRLDDDKRQELQSAIESAMEKDKVFCDPNFSLSSLSEIVGSNQTYVSQVINETYGKNFTDFLNDYRVREACVRLLDTDRYGKYTIGGIATDVGYKAQSTFIRAFRKKTGLSPSIYQKMALANGKVGIMS